MMDAKDTAVTVTWFLSNNVFWVESFCNYIARIICWTLLYHSCPAAKFQHDVKNILENKYYIRNNVTVKHLYFVCIKFLQFD